MTGKVYPWHQFTWSKLQGARTDGRLPHALLFSGDEGCGHETLMQSLVKSFLCLMPVDDAEGQACGTCRSCQVFESGAHPDYKMIAAPADKQVISVDQIRGLNHFLELSRSYSPSRVVLIHEAGRMNINAANSLLKSLEEPSADTHILLFSSRASTLLPTIRSRCQQIRLPLPSSEQALAWLHAQSLTQDAELLLNLAGGKPMQALALDSGELIAARKLWQQQLLAVINRDKSIAEVGSEWAKQSKEQLLDWQLNTLHHALRYSLAGAVVPEEPETLALYEAASGRNVWALYDELLEMKGLATHPLNNQLFAENMLSLWLKS
ncbi:MAG: DNA polymerase III delta prime subunit (EC [uncultured Thiotrichaceae bacterium]|uniref:DNA-directed DNA polymerase n=1 Tax=uncultured Thiotrichaceae bacterium TaxID=298394 RepID=A0A6S6SRS2_9GAMM|nr:MAG: DNA polymerase III delta prime subunit (EC [uncultured Thiotrichaceae bacterium]